MVRVVPRKLPGSSLGLNPRSTPHLIQVLRQGLPFRTLECLSMQSQIPVTEIASLIGIPPRTLARRKITGRLVLVESERLLRISRIFEFAVALFQGGTLEAVTWLRSRSRALDGSSPLAFATTELGAREVENLIGQLEYGVFP